MVVETVETRAGTLVIERSGPLAGTVRVSGAKNAALPILAACLLTEDESVIEQVPHVTDVMTTMEILRALGVEVVWEDGRLVVRPNQYSGWTAPYELVSLMRASICVLGPLLAKKGRARVSMPGGCIIGARPIDLHLKGLEALGATISIDHGYIVAEATRLRGATVHLAGPAGSSVLATANVMMASTLADGMTVIEHAACEPEVVDLATFLIDMGAKISGHGTPQISVEGVRRLHGAHHRIIPDRIEAGTLMMATAMLGGDVTIEAANAQHLGAVIDRLTQAHVSIEDANRALRIRSPGTLHAVDVTTLSFPGFPTDLQPQFVAMMSISHGVSVVTEKVYPERFMHVPELNRMGAQISREGPTVVIKGVEALSGAPVVASDLRGAAALVLAGLVADNHTIVQGVEHLDRGYEQLEQKLAKLGAHIRRERN